MVQFTFIAGKAFLENNRRYTTVPKSQIDYGVLEGEGLCVDDLSIICPEGERMSGFMYYGVAGYGPYYQIRINGYDNDPLSKLEYHQKLNVEIMRDGKKVYVEYSNIN